MIRVDEIRPGSIGADLRIERGTLLLRINGNPIRDSLDLQFLEADARLELEVEGPDGRSVVFEIEKDLDESLGLVPQPDKVRRCTNACPFCFVKGNPKRDKLRSSLYIKDDDYRLSFMFGHYVTLTNLREEDWQRIFEQRLSPLFVSVHAMDPAVRLEMLRNPRAARIGEHLDRLANGGIRIHAQVVLCPGLNDGSVLDHTLDDLYSRGDAVASFSVVPVGLTEFNRDQGVHGLTAREAGQTLEQVDLMRVRARAERGHAWCYAADEMFLLAGRELPDSGYFDDGELIGNGVGAMTRLRDQVRLELDRVPDLRGRRIVLVTGTSMAPLLHDVAHEITDACGAQIQTAPVVNGLYGSQVTTAGLLAGADHERALAPYAEFDLALFSRQALDDHDRFLDDLSLDQLRARYPSLEICPSDHVTDVLIPA